MAWGGRDGISIISIKKKKELIDFILHACLTKNMDLAEWLQWSSSNHTHAIPISYSDRTGRCVCLIFLLDFSTVQSTTRLFSGFYSFFATKNFFLLKTKKSSGEEVARMQFAASLKEWKMMISEV